MKKLITLILFFILSYSFAQQKTNVENVVVNSLKFNCNSIEEISEINWKDIREIINMNDPEDNISLEFGLNEKTQKKKVKGSFKFSIKGKSKDVDNLIKKAQKGVKTLKRMSNKIKAINEN